MDELLKRSEVKENLPIFQKSIIISLFIILTITVIVIAVNLDKEPDAETIAQSVLNKTYGITLEDSENLTKAIMQSVEDNTIIFNYLHSVYGEHITENGYNVMINNRIPSRAMRSASEENSDLKVISIQLENRDAVKDSKAYAFTVEVETVKEPAKTFTFKGSMGLIQENGHWKVNGISPQ